MDNIVDAGITLRDANEIHDLPEEASEPFDVHVGASGEAIRLVFSREGETDRQVWIEQKGDNIVVIPASDADRDADCIVRVQGGRTTVESNNGHDDERVFNGTSRPR